MLHQRGEARQVGEHKAALLTLAAQLQRTRLVNQMRHQVGRHVARERLFDPGLPTFSGQVTHDAGCAKTQRDDQTDQYRVQQQAVDRERPPRPRPEQSQHHRHQAKRHHCGGGQRQPAHTQAACHQRQRLQRSGPRWPLQARASQQLLDHLGMNFNPRQCAAQRAEAHVQQPLRGGSYQQYFSLQRVGRHHPFHHLPGGNIAFWHRPGVVQPHFPLRVGGYGQCTNANILQCTVWPSCTAGHDIFRPLRHAQRLGGQRGQQLIGIAQQQRDAANHAIRVRHKSQRTAAVSASL